MNGWTFSGWFNIGAVWLGCCVQVVVSGSGVDHGGVICIMIFRWDYDMAVV